MIGPRCMLKNGCMQKFVNLAVTFENVSNNVVVEIDESGPDTVLFMISSWIFNFIPDKRVPLQ